MNIPIRWRCLRLVVVAFGASAMLVCAEGCVRETSARDFLAQEDVVLTPMTGDLAEVETGE